jgi:hypothetical protein
VSWLFGDHFEMMEEEGVDEQSVLRANNGTTYGLFNNSIGLKKRKKHNVETRALFVGIVKSLYTAPREALFEVLRGCGLPNHF